MKINIIQQKKERKQDKKIDLDKVYSEKNDEWNSFSTPPQSENNKKAFRLYKKQRVIYK